MDEVIGEKMSLLKSDLHSKAYYDDLWTTIKAGKVWQGEIINKRRDGSHYTEEMTITPVTDAEGEIQNYIAIKQDVTERKNASDMVRRIAESQRVINYFSTLLSMSNDVEEILWDITSNCISEMGLEDAVIYLFESDSDVLLQRAAYGKSKARDNQIINPLRIPLGHYLRAYRNVKMMMDKGFNLIEMVRVSGKSRSTILQYRELVYQYHPDLKCTEKNSNKNK